MPSPLRPLLDKLAARLGLFKKAPSTLRIVEVQDAAPVAGELFFRAFRQTIPDFPRHFVLLHEAPGAAPVTLGYVHHTAFESAWLAGGLVVDAWKFRQLPRSEQDEVRRHGGMAEWLMAESCSRLQPCDAVYACIGDARSVTVNTRVGFRPARPPYLYILPSAAGDMLELLTDRVAARGLF